MNREASINMRASVTGWISGIVVALVGFAIGMIFNNLIVAGILFVILGLFAIPYGRGVATGKMYDGGAMNIWRFIVDMTWSSLNTAAAAIYYSAHRATGNTLNVPNTQGTGAIWLDKGVVPQYATTIGTVKAGSNSSIDDHEMIHVFQARLFGPFYLILVGLNYVIASIIPYWLLMKHKPITGFGSYFEDGVYPHVWNELWAYGAAGH
jgi:hypothetical protein